MPWGWGTSCGPPGERPTTTRGCWSRPSATSRRPSRSVGSGPLAPLPGLSRETSPGAPSYVLPQLDPESQKTRSYLQTVQGKLGNGDGKRPASASSSTPPVPPRPESLPPRPPTDASGGASASGQASHEAREAPSDPLHPHQPSDYASTIGKLEELIRAEEDYRKRKKKKKKKKKHKKVRAVVPRWARGPVY
jgi:hypothetical protein